MRRRRPPARRLRPAAAPVRAERPADPRTIRRRQEALEAELDNREQARRRAAAEAFMAEAAEAARQVLAGDEPPRPVPASPVLAVPVRRVLTRTALAICVEAWGFEVWLPLGAIFDPDSPVVTDHLPGEVLVSSSWAARAGLPPTTRSSP